LHVLAVALAAPSIAAADTPQGRLGGHAFIGPTNISVGFGDFPVIDGGTTFVGLENDKSGSCSGDTGKVGVNGTTFDVVCAHYVASSGHFNTGSQKMRFMYDSTPPVAAPAASVYTVVRITDSVGSTDTFAWGTTNSISDATEWVNRGVKGSGHPFSNWSFESVSDGDYQVTPS